MRVPRAWPPAFSTRGWGERRQLARLRGPRHVSNSLEVSVSIAEVAGKEQCAAALGGQMIFSAHVSLPMATAVPVALAALLALLPL